MAGAVEALGASGRGVGRGSMPEPSRGKRPSKQEGRGVTSPRIKISGTAKGEIRLARRRYTYLS